MSSPLVRIWLPVLLIAIGALRIAGTWQLLTQTFDESYHIACALEWWDAKKYERERQHPPLSRIAMGALPYLIDGAKEPPEPNPIIAGNQILGLGPQYFHRLAQARAGILPFYFIFCIAIWRWTSRRLGPAAGLGAVFMGSHLPPILGHAGLATTDMAPVAMLALALWRWDEWLLEGGAPNASLTGLAAGGALGAKASCLLLLPLCGGALWLYRRRLHKTWLRDLAIITILSLVVLSGFYRFKKEYVIPRETGANRTIAGRLIGLHAFLGAYINGLEEVRQHNDEGHYSYLMGYGYRGRDWLFFPIAIAVKTPIPILILFLLALRYRQTRWAAILALIPLLALMPGKINLGVRHAMPVYVGMSIAAGYALSELWKTRRLPAYALSAWLAANVALAHPDYIAWFNEFTAGRPELFLAESDLDWGQDLHRVAAAMDRRGIAQCKLAYFGNADWQNHFPNRFKEFRWEDGSEGGCYAISIRHQSLEAGMARAHGNEPPFAWLDKYQPVERVGKSFRIYDIPPARPGQ